MTSSSGYYQVASYHPPQELDLQRDLATSQPVWQVDEESEDDSDNSMQPIYTLEQGWDTQLLPIKVHLELDHCSVPMEVDIGASVSIMPETLYCKLWPRRGLKETRDYQIANLIKAAQAVAVVGTTDVEPGTTPLKVWQPHYH